MSRKITSIKDIASVNKRSVVAVECPEVDAVFYLGSPSIHGMFKFTQLQSQFKDGKSKYTLEMRSGVAEFIADCLTDEDGRKLKLADDVVSAVADLPWEASNRLFDAAVKFVTKKSAASGEEVPVPAGEGSRDDGGADRE